MRCLSCNVNLSDYEISRRSLTTGDYIDLCNRCFSDIQDGIIYVANPKLSHECDESGVFSQQGEISIDKDSVDGYNNYRDNDE